MEIKRHSRNVHSIFVDSPDFELAVLTDLHWDNPKCKLDILKRHLDECLEKDIKVIFPGDFFCLMQGRADRRSSKSDIRPEHNNAKYIDSVIETAVEWFKPYASIMLLIGYGNHETAILKWSETDVLERFVQLFNHVTGANVQVGGYGGHLVVTQNTRSKAATGSRVRATTIIKYFHGSGGGGIVTKGAINLTRALEMYENIDVFIMGHIHENAARTDVRETLTCHPKKGYYIKHKEIHLMICGTYKEEYVDGHGGWHVERGAPPKLIGGRILSIKNKSINNGLVKRIDSRRL